jgi:hypothetical protein
MATQKANGETKRGEPKYEVTVKLTGTDGNAFALMGKVNRALQGADVSKELRDEFMDECMSGDYNHLLRVCMKWVNVE